MPLPASAERDTGIDTIYVIDGGWHTELALEMRAISGPLSALEPRFAGARYLVFGWGARGFYMAPQPGIGALLRASVPGPAVMLVIPLMVSPSAFAGSANVDALRATRAGIAGLSRYLSDDLAASGDAVPRPIGAGPYPQSVFYAARGRYDLADTCNTWTALGLRAAGLPVSAAGVVFAHQILDQVARLAPPAAADSGSPASSEPSRDPPRRE